MNQIIKDKADIKLELSDAEICHIILSIQNLVKRKVESFAILDLEASKKQKSMKLKISSYLRNIS